MPLTPGTRLGPYETLALIGAGGMGQVFVATDTRLHRKVAIKILPPAEVEDPDRRRRFVREAQAASALNHPNIVGLYDIAVDGNELHYLVMEFVEGQSLAQLIQQGRLSLDEVFDFATQIADALTAAHAAGVVHRDIKPANIMVTTAGQIKVLDFGLAKMEECSGEENETRTLQAALTRTGMVMGTLAYMSPEQARGETVDARTDLFSFGAVLYEMATGQRAFPKKLNWATPSAANLPQELRAIVLKLLETDPGLRYQHSSELRTDLLRLRRDTQAASVAGQMRAASGVGKRRTAIAAAAALIAVGAAGYFYSQRRLSGVPKLTNKDMIVIADFENKTGDPVFDDTLRQGLIVQLQQSPYLSFIPDQKIRATLNLMGKPVGSALSGETAREVCVRVGARAVLAGSIANLGSNYVMSLRSEGCANGEALDSQQSQASGKDQVLNKLGEMAGKFRAGAGESLATIQEHNVPLEEATTPSLEALKAYTAAITLSGDAATNQLRHATELDPAFAAAWSLLAILYSGEGETERSRQSAIRAYGARERASGPEKFNIEYSYHRNVTGDLEKAWQSVSLWRQTYPRDSKAFALSGGYAANGTGRFEQVLELSVKSVELEPDQLYGYINQAGALLLLGRLEEAEKAFAVAASRHAATVPSAQAAHYRLALLRGDTATIAKILAESRGNRDSETTLAQIQALAAANDGRLSESDRFSRSAVEMAIRAGLRERTAVFQAAPAVWNALYGNKAAARQIAETALKTFTGRDIAFAAGFALALGGDGIKAEALANKLNKEYPEDTHVQATYVPALLAIVALNRNDPRKAIDLLEANRAYEFGIPPIAFVHFYGNMYPIYIRGLAYLAMGKAEEAAGEFRRLLAHRGLAVGDPVEAAARRQLARALGTAGDTAKARSAYRDFFALWKEPALDIPILVEAKAEYARLQ